jgi:hypothetical protein
VSGAGLVAQLQNAPSGGETLHGALAMARIHGVPDATLTDLMTRGGDRGVEESVLRVWIQNLDSVASRGLPVAPVASRYLEGLAKGIPAARIDAAVATLVARLEQAARHIDTTYPEPANAGDRAARLTAIDHTAYVLGLGFDDQTMNRSLAMVRQESEAIVDLNAPMLTLGILVASGIGAEKSLEVVDAAWNHGYRGSTLERLGKALGRAGKEGTSPDEVVDQVLQMIGEDTAQENVFKEMDHLTGRDDYQLPGLGPGDDPTIRRGDTDRKLGDKPSDNPDTRDQFKGDNRATQ